MGKTVVINGREFSVSETENEVILTTKFGTVIIENVFKKETLKDKEVISSLGNTLKTALHDYIEKKF